MGTIRNLLKCLCFIAWLGCAVDSELQTPLGSDDPNALKDAQPGGSPYTMLIEVPYHNGGQKGAYFMPVKGTGIRIGPCTVLSAAHLMMSQPDYYNHSRFLKPDWLLNWQDVRAYPIAQDGTPEMPRRAKNETVAVHPSMLNRDEVSIENSQPIVEPGNWPPVDSTFDIVVFQVNGLPSPQSQYRLPTLSGSLAAANTLLSVDGNSFSTGGTYQTRLSRSVSIKGMSRSEPKPSFYTEPVMEAGNSGGPLYRRIYGNGFDTTELFGILSGQRAVFTPLLGTTTVFSRVDGEALYDGVSVKAWIEAHKAQHETDPACYSFGT